jgi:hypothetical protein
MTRVALLALAAALLVPAVAGAQAASPDAAGPQAPADTQLRLEREHRRVIVHPSPPPDVVQHDAQSAQAEIEQREREQHIVGELRRPQSRRPDLGYDVSSGIQSQRLNKALR